MDPFKQIENLLNYQNGQPTTDPIEQLESESSENSESEEIDINDYKLADEETEYGKYTDIMNVFLCHFKQLFTKKQNATLFEDIDYDKNDSTNRGMEFIFGEITKYNQSGDESKDKLYSPDSDEIDIELCEELYILYLESEPIFVSKYLFTLVSYVASINWSNIEWSLIKIKG